MKWCRCRRSWSQPKSFCQRPSFRLLAIAGWKYRWVELSCNRTPKQQWCQNLPSSLCNDSFVSLCEKSIRLKLYLFRWSKARGSSVYWKDCAYTSWCFHRNNLSEFADYIDQWGSDWIWLPIRQGCCVHMYNRVLHHRPGTDSEFTDIALPRQWAVGRKQTVVLHK